MNDRMFTLEEYEDVKRRAYDKGYYDAVIDASYVVSRLPLFGDDFNVIVRSDAIIAIKDLDEDTWLQGYDVEIVDD